MIPDIYFEIIYQLHLLDKLLEKEKNVLKIAKYEGMKEALLYILSLEEKL
jgi:hypothetical protein